MGFQDYISESEAMQRAGVSARTLARFAEAGYLHYEVEPDGLKLFCRKELDEIFGQDALNGTGNDAAHGSEQSVSAKPNTDAQNVVEEQPHEPTTNVAEEPVTNTPIYSVERVVEVFADLPLQTPVNVATDEALAESAVTGPTETEHSTSAFDKADVPAHDNDDLTAREITRLRNLIAAQEKLLDAKEADVFDLRNQRDWLKTRIERLEEKGERDQVLLLSEAQTVKQLIALHDRKRSSLKQLLAWLGLAPVRALPAIPSGVRPSALTHSPNNTDERTGEDRKSAGNE